MKLHVTPGSPNCRKVEAAIHHFGAEVEIVRLDIFSGEHKTDEYLALNPNGTLPILEHGGFALWESNAILNYLFPVDGEASLDSARRQADVLRWQFWEAAHYGKATGELVWENFAKPKFGIGETNAEAVKSATNRYHQFAAVLENHLAANGPYVLGREVSVADFTLASHAAFLDAAQVPYLDYPSIAAWYAKLNGLPAWKATEPDFGSTAEA